MPIDPGDHPSFRHPDEDAHLWRYMDLSKYLAMLTSSSLWLSRSDLLGDPFEGSTTQATLDAWSQSLDELELDDDALRERLMTSSSQVTRLMIRWTYVNCWHMNESESAAMWRLYRRGHGVAVRSSYGRMRSAVKGDVPVHVGKVEYMDYDCHDAVITSGPALNTFDPFMRKRLSFEHEREVRMITNLFGSHLDPEESKGKTEAQLQAAADAGGPDGMEVPADISELVEQVRIDPDAPGWFSDVVEHTTRALGFSFDVRHSDLSRDPLY